MLLPVLGFTIFFLTVIALVLISICGFLLWLNCCVWEIDPVEILESNDDVRRLFKAVFILGGMIFFLGSFDVAPRPIEPILRILFSCSGVFALALGVHFDSIIRLLRKFKNK